MHLHFLDGLKGSHTLSGERSCWKPPANPASSQGDEKMRGRCLKGPAAPAVLSSSLTLDSTSALWSFCSSSAAALVSSLRAAMCRAGSRTFPLVSFSRSRETTWSWPCWSATARGVKPSWRGQDRKVTEAGWLLMVDGKMQVPQWWRSTFHHL